MNPEQIKKMILNETKNIVFLHQIFISVYYEQYLRKRLFYHPQSHL